MRSASFLRFHLLVSFLAVLAVLAAVSKSFAAAEKSGPVTIEDIMKNAHKGNDSLVKKAIGGKASQEEIKQLIAYYLALEKLEPPKGSADSWKERTAALSKAAIFLFAEKEGAVQQLEKASNCKACHSVHRAD